MTKSEPLNPDGIDRVAARSSRRPQKMRPRGSPGNDSAVDRARSSQAPGLGTESAGCPSHLRRAPVQTRAIRRIERVLDAAEQVFGEVGYGAATTNHIASRAQTSIGSVYQFFGDKQAVAGALAERYLIDFADLCCEVLNDPHHCNDISGPFVEAFGEFYSERPGLDALLRACDPNERLVASRKLQAGLVEHVGRLIGETRQAFDPTHCHLMAQVCTGILCNIFGDVARRPPHERSALVAELKLVLASYLAVALPGEQQGEPPSGAGGSCAAPNGDVVHLEHVR